MYSNKDVQLERHRLIRFIRYVVVWAHTADNKVPGSHLHFPPLQWGEEKIDQQA